MKVVIELTIENDDKNENLTEDFVLNYLPDSVPKFIVGFLNSKIEYFPLKIDNIEFPKNT